MVKNEDIIEKIVNKVIKDVNINWNKLQTIRYVYLKLGEYLEKNTDFFLNEKLDKEGLSLSDEDMHSIYFDNKINISNRNNSQEQYQVICKSAAFILKECFDKLNIDSNLIHTTGETSDMHHWFIAVKGDNDEQFFLTLVADLPFIKNSLPTEHFANHIGYLDPNGNPIYVIPKDTKLSIVPATYIDKDGNERKTTEIKHTVLTGDKESLKRLKEIDESIGYGKLYDIKELYTRRELYDMFLKFSEENSKVYEILKNSFNIPKNDAILIDSITKEQVSSFKNELEIYIGNKLLPKINSKKNYKGNSLKRYILASLKDINLTHEDLNLSSKELLFKYKKELEKNNKEITSVIEILFILEDRFDNYIEVLEKYDELEKEVDKDTILSKDEIYNLQKKIIDISNKLDNCKKNLSINKLNKMLDRLAFYFIKDKLIYDKNEYIPLDYIVTKFELMFPIVFDCNYGKDRLTNHTFFSIQNYSEQITIIKQMLKKIFSELTEKNCQDIESYNNNYSPVENRIITYPLKDRKTKEYCIAFAFGAKAEENTVRYIYIPSENLLRRRDPIQDQKRYWIVSERFNKKLQKIENIEDNSNELSTKKRKGK